jgi:hypothetical protein
MLVCWVSFLEPHAIARAIKGMNNTFFILVELGWNC